jgi:hypothetical protein
MINSKLGVPKMPNPPPPPTAKIGKKYPAPIAAAKEAANKRQNELHATKIVILLDQPIFPETEDILREIINEAFAKYKSYNQDNVFITPTNIAGTLEL